MAQVQQNAEIWGRLLWVAGGLLEFLKSSYFLVIWWFNKDDSPTITTDLPTNTVQLTNAQGSTSKLQQVSLEEGIEMLDVRRATTMQEDSE
eukprot:6356123-Ditylum_brightwellii.AAC.1